MLNSLSTKRFGFAVPTSCPGVPEDVLIPRETWPDKDAYDATADKLASMFNTNFEDTLMAFPMMSTLLHLVYNLKITIRSMVDVKRVH